MFNKENAHIFLIAVVAALVVSYFVVRNKVPVVNPGARLTKAS